MSYVHRNLPAAGCWTVGFYDGGEWEPVSDHDSEHAAADEASRLNGCATRARLIPVQEPAVIEAREARATRDSKALSAALCGGQHALYSLESLLSHPDGLAPAEFTYIVRTADRLRWKLAEAERLEKMT